MVTSRILSLSGAESKSFLRSSAEMMGSTMVTGAAREGSVSSGGFTPLGICTAVADVLLHWPITL